MNDRRVSAAIRRKRAEVISWLMIRYSAQPIADQPTLFELYQLADNTIVEMLKSKTYRDRGDWVRRLADLRNSSCENRN